MATIKEKKALIQAVLNRKDDVGMHAIGRALLHLYNRQTNEEQAREDTVEHNGVGFTGFDGKIGASMAKQYAQKGYLTGKQCEIWRKPVRNGSETTKIGKYWRQLMEEMDKKQAAKAADESVDEAELNFEEQEVREVVMEQMAEQEEYELAKAEEEDFNNRWKAYKSEFAQREIEQDHEAELEKMDLEERLAGYFEGNR